MSNDTLKGTVDLISRRMAELESGPAREASQAQGELAPILAEAEAMLREIAELRATYGADLSALNSIDFTKLQLRLRIPETLVRSLRRIVTEAYVLLEATYSFLVQVPAKAKQTQDEFMARSLRNEIDAQRGNAYQVQSYLKQLFAPRPDRYGRDLPSLIEDFNSRLEAAGLPAPTKTWLRTEKPQMPSSYPAKDRAGDEGLEGQPR